MKLGVGRCLNRRFWMVWLAGVGRDVTRVAEGGEEEGHHAARVQHDQADDEVDQLELMTEPKRKRSRLPSGESCI